MCVSATESPVPCLSSMLSAIRAAATDGDGVSAPALPGDAGAASSRVRPGVQVVRGSGPVTSFVNADREEELKAKKIDDEEKELQELDGTYVLCCFYDSAAPVGRESATHMRFQVGLPLRLDKVCAEG